MCAFAQTLKQMMSHTSQPTAGATKLMLVEQRHETVLEVHVRLGEEPQHVDGRQLEGLWRAPEFHIFSSVVRRRATDSSHNIRMMEDRGVTMTDSSAMSNSS